MFSGHRRLSSSPACFSAPQVRACKMVRAILEGRKTQTRRPITKILGVGKISGLGRTYAPGYDWEARDSRSLWHNLTDKELLERCPLGQPGDRLWVRETWRCWFPLLEDGQPQDDNWHCRYRADGLEQRTDAEWGSDDSPQECGVDTEGEKWRPSIHMPRWASRITLNIVDIRVERLWDIRTIGCLTEGFKLRGMNPFDRANNAITDFRESWDAIYENWDDNPWVWVIEFERCREGSDE